LNYPIPILLYHRIEDSSKSTATSPTVFRQHLVSLKEQGWKSLSAQEFAFIMQSGRPASDRSFLITFDDGYETVHSAALQILRELDFKAISFLSTGLLRNPRTGMGEIAPDDERNAFMTWDHVRELQAGGVIDCQSHSHMHVNFTGQALNEIRQDLATSLDLLSSELALPRSHFSHLAWPWGLSNKEWRKTASDVGFTYQYGVSRQAARPASPIDQIPRTCFDANTFQQFQRQLWLQTSQLSHAWNLAYPVGRTLRRLANFART
jgi:peptidoglycan/xylan/chitin deacetylase (PgdA/CDA1 family)